jgi:NAD(P)H-hydrate epimerase
MKLVTSKEMQQIEQECAKAGLPAEVLMENAGKAVAEEVRHILGDIKQKHVLFLIGPGNNGGDGLVAARYLHDWGAEVSVFLASQRAKDDSNLQMVQKQGIRVIEFTQDKDLLKFDELLSSSDCVIDALFGTGRIRPLQGVFQQVLDRVAQAKKERAGLLIIAVDLPSGVNADSGAVDPSSPFVDNTITLGFPKLGLFSFPGAERIGKVTTVDIGIPDHLAESITTELVTDEWASNTLPKRPLDANKGSFGRVLVVAGSINYIGAAYLAGSGAMRTGAGLVTMATAATLLPILAAKLTEATYLPLPESEPGIISPEAVGLIGEQLNEYDVLLLGCGLGQRQSVIDFTRAMLLNKGMPALVLDADALNVLARTPNWWQQLANDAILTPHPGEMGRLSGLSIEKVQSDKTGTAKKFAEDWQKVIVLKGANTIIAAPDGRVMVSPIVNPGLASAGTGDVLSGTIAGFLAQGLPPFKSAVLGVYIHGKAGEMVRDRLGDAGMVATDLLPALPVTIKQLKEKNHPTN